ncbi:MAG: CbtA family protein [Actinobacteria bacterium]|nr:MAG: CbtA family protein [Actinomycetota bacterium]
MARTYLVRGMLAGLFAGLCALGFAKLGAEPQIKRAERFELQLDLQLRRAAPRPLVSRQVQDTVGLGTGIAVAGVAVGGLYGLAFAGAYRRMGNSRAEVTAIVLAAAGFLGLFLVPFLKYPSNPPSVGNPDTIGHRTALYFLLVAVGLVSVSLAVMVKGRSVARLGTWNASLLAVATFVALVVLSYVVTPGVDEVPAGFPATLLWKFRMASIGTQAVLWGTLGVAFGALTERHESSRRRRPDGSSPPRAHDEVVEKVMVAPGATSSRALRSSSDG